MNSSKIIRDIFTKILLTKQDIFTQINQDIFSIIVNIPLLVKISNKKIFLMLNYDKYTSTPYFYQF